MNEHNVKYAAELFVFKPNNNLKARIWIIVSVVLFQLIVTTIIMV